MYLQHPVKMNQNLTSRFWKSQIGSYKTNSTLDYLSSHITDSWLQRRQSWVVDWRSAAVIVGIGVVWRLDCSVDEMLHLLHRLSLHSWPTPAPCSKQIWGRKLLRKIDLQLPSSSQLSILPRRLYLGSVPRLSLSPLRGFLHKRCILKVIHRKASI